MSVHAIIIFQLSFMLCTLLVVSVLIIRNFKQKINAGEAQVLKLKRQLKARGGGSNNSTSVVPLKPDNSAQVLEPAAQAELQQAVEDAPIESVLNDMTSALQRDADDLNQLDSLIADQSATIERIRQMREAMEAKAKSKAEKKQIEILQAELKAAQQQNQQSTQAIESLKGSLERSRFRVSKVEREMARAREALQQISRVEKENKRLEHDKANLKKNADQAMKSHHDAIERIQMKLQRAEGKAQQYAEEAAARERSLMTTVNELQAQLKEVADSDPEMVAALEAALTKAQEELDLALREKTFIETQFVDLEQALEESAAAKVELERTRKEYEMLEQHFLEMEEAAKQSTPAIIDQIGEDVAEDPEKLDLFDVEAAMATSDVAQEQTGEDENTQDAIIPDVVDKQPGLAEPAESESGIDEKDKVIGSDG